MCEHNKRNTGKSYCAYCAVNRVRELHYRTEKGECAICAYFSQYESEGVEWPCDTILALDGELPQI